MHIAFHGAARQVTGSCHLVECAGTRLLVDCGLFQGGRAVEEENREDFGFDPASIDFLLLTHAHLDHCGRIPLLVKRGFRGAIVCTAATRELARIVLADAASLQESEARQRAKRAQRDGGEAARPLYTLDDAFHAMDYFTHSVTYDRAIALADGIRASFIDAGHMLGSASIVLDLDEHGRHRRVVFSGDIGNPGRPLLRAPTPPPAADHVVIESTYGDRDHRPMPDSVLELQQAIADAIGRGGNVIVPTFALERAQEILFCLGEAVASGALPRSLPVFLDSPMAISATEIFHRYPECLGDDPRLHDGDLFELPHLRLTRDTADSIAINRIEGGAVILAGAGMCTGGRVLHHLKHNLWREHAAIVFVGYAAEGTPARRIIDGAQTMRLFGVDVRVRAKVWTINGFSAHAGRSDLTAWLAHAGRPRSVFLVHGEPARGMDAFADHLATQGHACVRPRPHERVELA